MKNKTNFFQWFKQTFLESNLEKKDQKNRKTQYILLIVFVGIIFMLVSNYFSPNEATQELAPVIKEADTPAFVGKSDDNPQTMEDYENHYENQLKEALNHIVGVNDVTVKVNVKSTAEKIYEKNTSNQTQTTSEVDSNNGKRQVEDKTSTEEVVIINNGEEEKPIIIMTNKPEISGVLVVANGAENIQVKKWIIEAVTRLLDVPSHRVSVLPKKTKGE